MNQLPLLEISLRVKGQWNEELEKEKSVPKRSQGRHTEYHLLYMYCTAQCCLKFTTVHDVSIKRSITVFTSTTVTAKTFKLITGKIAHGASAGI